MTESRCSVCCVVITTRPLQTASRGPPTDHQLQPFKALFTAARISSTVIAPFWFLSPASQAETGAFSKAILTITSSSLTVTAPSPPQSPTQLGFDVGVADGVGVSVPSTVPVVVGCPVGVAVCVGGGTPPVGVG